MYKVFSFEVASGSLATNTILPTGNEPILQRSLVTDDNHFQAVKNKISIIKKLMSRPDKAGLDPDLRLLMVRYTNNNNNTMLTNYLSSPMQHHPYLNIVPH